MKQIKIYMLPINIYFTTSREEFTKKTKEDTSGTNGMYFYNRATLSVAIGVFTNTIKTFNHELFHALLSINELIGSEINGSTNELNAYLFGEISEKCLKEFKKTMGELK